MEKKVKYELNPLGTDLCVYYALMFSVRMLLWIRQVEDGSKTWLFEET